MAETRTFTAPKAFVKINNQVAGFVRNLTFSENIQRANVQGLGSLTLQEAPAVSYTCKCGPAEIILDGKDGFLIPDGDERNFAERLSLLMCDTALRTRMGQAAHNDIARFSEDCIMTRWREIYERLITP